MESSLFSFRLSDEFINQYSDRDVKWGNQDAGHNSFSEVVFVDKYSRLKANGTKERWHEVCERVINGMYSIQKDHVKSNKLPWNDRKAQASAQEAYDRMFNFKWTPPGRGLAQMGAPLVMNGNSAALMNCAFISTADMTKNDPSYPFRFLMGASMLGIGVGFDLLGADKEFEIYGPDLGGEMFVIPDTREGWEESLGKLINCFLKPGQKMVTFDYSQIRPNGAPIKMFGGTASGPEALTSLHNRIIFLFESKIGRTLSTMDILDINNWIGAAVVAGSSRRSATLAMGKPDDKEFLHAKNSDWFPERNDYSDPDNPGWSYMSNNSLSVEVGQDYSQFVDNIAHNGEPGLIWMDVTRKFGRLIDPPNNSDYRAAGYNPCSEQPLESGELCTLADLYLTRHDSLEDFQRTIKFAYLYAKTVTLVPTQWDKTNAIMQRNRRIGLSTSGIADFSDARGTSELKTWFNKGYETVSNYDKIYSEWLCVRESIKMTTVKPAGTTGSMVGISPGAHWSLGGRYFLRSMRFLKANPIVDNLRQAGYTIEDDVTDPSRTCVAYFPIESESLRSDDEVTLWEKAMLAVTAQRYWSDNGVSVTVSFDKEKEADQIIALLHAVEGQLKAVSFLPRADTSQYKQLPYTKISKDEYESYLGKLKKIDMSVLYQGDNLEDAAGDMFCTTDFCLITP